MSTRSVSPDSLVSVAAHSSGEVLEAWRWMRAHDPVHWHPGGEFSGFWSVTRHADVRAVYQDAAIFTSAAGVLLRPADRGGDPGGGMTLALTDPPRHRDLRAVVAEWFGARSVRALVGLMRETTRALLRRAVDRGECEFVRDVAAPLSHAMICRLMGVPDADRESVFEWSSEAFHRGTSLTTHHELARYFVDLMERKVAEPADDIVTALVTGAPAGALLSAEEVLFNCENLLGATENGRLGLAGAVQALVEHPGQWRLLRARRDLIPGTVEETLRWTSSAVHSVRTAATAVELRGRRIAAGDKVALWLPSANRDEEVFAEPDRFDVSRTPNRHLAFAAGEHFCIGNVLARAETTVLLEELVVLAARLEPAGPVVPVRSIAVRGPERLPVRLVPA